MLKEFETVIHRHHEERSRESIEAVLACFMEVLENKEKFIIPVQKTEDGYNLKLIEEDDNKKLVLFTSEEKLNAGIETDFETVAAHILVNIALDEKLDVVVNPWDEPFYVKYDSLNSLIDFLNRVDAGEFDDDEELELEV